MAASIASRHLGIPPERVVAAATPDGKLRALRALQAGQAPAAVLRAAATGELPPLPGSAKEQQQGLLQLQGAGGGALGTGGKGGFRAGHSAWWMWAKGQRGAQASSKGREGGGGCARGPDWMDGKEGGLLAPLLPGKGSGEGWAAGEREGGGCGSIAKDGDAQSAARSLQGATAAAHVRAWAPRGKDNTGGDVEQGGKVVAEVAALPMCHARMGGCAPLGLGSPPDAATALLNEVIVEGGAALAQLATPPDSSAASSCCDEPTGMQQPPRRRVPRRLQQQRTVVAMVGGE